MKLEIKNLPFEIKEMDEKIGIIEGYASTFGNIDLGGDVVQKGAFKRSLKDNKNVPILKNHSPFEQMGWNLEAEEDEKGLLVKGEYNMADPVAKAAYSLAKKGIEIGAKVGLSIGYYTIKSEPDRDNPRIRKLMELKLVEYSQVTFPMNTQAMITAAKSFAQCGGIEEAVGAFVEEMLIRGYSKENVFKVLTKTSDPSTGHSDEIVETLRKINKTFKL